MFLLERQHLCKKFITRLCAIYTNTYGDFIICVCNKQHQKKTKRKTAINRDRNIHTQRERDTRQKKHTQCKLVNGVLNLLAPSVLDSFTEIVRSKRRNASSALGSFHNWCLFVWEGEATSSSSFTFHFISEAFRCRKCQPVDIEYIFVIII